MSNITNQDYCGMCPLEDRRLRGDIAYAWYIADGRRAIVCGTCLTRLKSINHGKEWVKYHRVEIRRI